MRLFDGEKFGPIYDRDSGALFSDLQFRRCQFLTCYISITENPALRSTVRSVQVYHCDVQASSVDNAILEDILVDGLKTHGRFDTWGAVFKHVTLKGRIGNLKVSDFIVAADASPALRHKINLRFQAANAEYYRNVDWALDISEAEFEECEIKGVPGHLIRRDPENKVLVNRSKVLELENEWRRLDLSKTHWATSLQSMIKKEQHADRVLIVPRRSKSFKELLNGLNLLRRVGVAEPD